MTMVPMSVAVKMDGRKAATIRGFIAEGKARAEKRRVGGRDLWFVDLDSLPRRRPLRKPDGVCRRCKQARKIANGARMLCGTCVAKATRLGELDDFPLLRGRKSPRSEVLLEEFSHIRKFLGYHGAVQRLAVVYKVDPLTVQKTVGACFPVSEYKEAV